MRISKRGHRKEKVYPNDPQSKHAGLGSECADADKGLKDEDS
jgi:hypothetical protein